MKVPNLDSLGIDPRNPMIPMAASLFIPGSGQLYNGETSKAAIVFLLAAMAWITAWPFVLPIVLYGAYDAYITAGRPAVESDQKGATVAAFEQTQASEFVEKIDKLYTLVQGGILTEPEYDAKVGEVILSIEKKKPAETPEDFLTALIPIVRSGALKAEQLAKIKTIIGYW